MSIKIAVTGAAGRMGRRIIAMAFDDPGVHVVAALEIEGNASIGKDAGELAGVGCIGVPVAASLDADFDVLVEFSLPEGTMRSLEECEQRSRPIVIGATGHSDADITRIREASERIPVLKAPNMSVGINVLLRLAKQLGAALDAAYDVEISETHHRFKADAPSGTALALRDAIAEGRTSAGAEQPASIYGRHGKSGTRPAGEIGIHSLRVGDTVGEHTIAFGTLGETVTIDHTAHSRDTFAGGAIRATKWIVDRPAGLYDMQDVIGDRR